MNKSLLALYGLKWNPFSPELPTEALLTTATGLMIAIPATIGYNYFVSAIDRFTIEMEEAAMELIEALETMKP